MGDDEVEPDGRSGPRLSPGLVGAILVASAFAAFVAQNTATVEVTWLVFDASVPLWLSLVVSAAAGVVLAELVTRVVRRSRRRD